MSRTRSAAQLVPDVRSRCDQLTSNGSLSFIQDSEILEWLNQAWTILYDKLIKSGEHYYLRGGGTPGDFQTSSQITDYPIPVDHYKTVGLDLLIGGFYYSAHRFQFEERNNYQSVTGSWSWPIFVWYDLWQTNIHFIPTPDGSYPVRHYYYPVAQRMQMTPGTTNIANDPIAQNSFIDGVNGWEQFVIDWAAKMCAQRDENFELASSLSADIASHEERILSMVSSRHPMEAPKARVIRGRAWAPGTPRRWWSW